MSTLRNLFVSLALLLTMTAAVANAKSADPIIVHPDVRRMLMDQKAFIEGARAFTYWTALHGDLQEKSPDEKVREKAEDYMGLMTPVVKAYLTHKGFESANLGLQVHGGSGFTREWGMEQYVRDCRISLIYEGTNGIQALDLVGRKLPAKGGKALRGYLKLVGSFISQNKDNEALAPMMAKLSDALTDLQDATTWLMSNAMTKPDNAGAASVPYLHLMALVMFGHMWGQIAKAALAGIAAGDGDIAFYEHKLTTANYFFTHMLAETAVHKARVGAGAQSMMALAAEAF